MRILIIIVILFLIIIALLDILADKVDKHILAKNILLENQNERLKQTLTLVRNDLFLATLKECPQEEKDNIIQENIEFIDEIKKVWWYDDVK